MANTRIQVENIDLTVARTDDPIFYGGFDTLLVQNVGDLNANVTLKFHGRASDPVPILTGNYFNFNDDFEAVHVTNAAVAAGTLVLVATKGIKIGNTLRITSDQIQQGTRQQTLAVAAVATAIPAVAFADRINMTIYNSGATTVYIGSATVTVAGATGGVPLPAGASMSFTIAPNVIIYAIAAVAGQVSIIEGA